MQCGISSFLFHYSHFRVGFCYSRRHLPPAFRLTRLRPQLQCIAYNWPHNPATFLIFLPFYFLETLIPLPFFPHIIVLFASHDQAISAGLLRISYLCFLPSSCPLFLHFSRDIFLCIHMPICTSLFPSFLVSYLAGGQWHQAGSDIPCHEKSSAEQGGVEATYTCRTCLRAKHLMMMVNGRVSVAYSMVGCIIIL